MWGIVRKAINTQGGTGDALDTLIGQRNVAAASAVNNTNPVMAYLKGILTRAAQADSNSATLVSRLTAGRANNLDNMTSQVRDSAIRLTESRAQNLDLLNGGSGARARVSVQRGTVAESFTGLDSSITINISSVDPARSYVIVQTNAATGSHPGSGGLSSFSSFGMGVSMTSMSATSITFRRGFAASSSMTPAFSWQVVSFS